MKTIRTLSFAALLSTFAAKPAHATDLTIGGGPTNVSSGYTPRGFTVLQVGEGGEFNPALNVTVNIAWAVISNDVANPLHGLTFEYQVTTIGTNVSQLELSGFTGLLSLVNVASTTASSLGLSESYFTAGGTAPASADWLGQLDFNWSSSPGVTDTDVVIVDTAATGWREADGASIDNGAFPGQLVVVPIPEPGSIRLAALGGAALLWLGCRRAWRPVAIGRPSKEHWGSISTSINDARPRLRATSNSAACPMRLASGEGKIMSRQKLSKCYP